MTGYAHSKLTLRILQPRRGKLAGAACLGALVLTAPAAAHSGRYVTRTLTEAPRPGLAVTGPLSDMVVTSRARVVVPLAWQRRSASTGRLRFEIRQNPSCRYNVSYEVKSVLTPAQDAGDYVTARLPAASARHLLDSGQRGNRAFRVVRRQGSSGQVRLHALWAGVLTRRADITPAGQVARTEIGVAATSRAGDECHSGTWREAVGPAIGDSLAVARTRLHFQERR